MSADQIGLHSVQLPLLIAAVVCVLTLFLSVRVSESTHFPQCDPDLVHMWAEFVVGFLLCSKRVLFFFLFLFLFLKSKLLQ